MPIHPKLLTSEMVEDHYHRWREMVMAVSRHSGYLVANSSLLPFYRDLIDRLLADEWWTRSPQGGKHPAEFLMWVDIVPDDRFLIWTERRGMQTPRQFFGPSGFGRLTFRPISDDGVRPWDTAGDVLGRPKQIEPDDPEQGLELP